MAHHFDMLGDRGWSQLPRADRGGVAAPDDGRYLTSIRNRSADPRTGRVPDENYAREVMQLFSIGLVELNDDGR